MAMEVKFYASVTGKVPIKHDLGLQETRTDLISLEDYMQHHQ